MTGKEIANNLRNSKLKWRRHHTLYFTDTDEAPPENKEPSFCVIGIKALEAGVSLEQLYCVPAHAYNAPEGITTLHHLNDSCNSKEELIKKLEESYSKVRFDIEGAIKLLKNRPVVKSPFLTEGVRAIWERFTQSEAYLDAIGGKHDASEA